MLFRSHDMTSPTQLSIRVLAYPDKGDVSDVPVSPQKMHVLPIAAAEKNTSAANQNCMGQQCVDASSCMLDGTAVHVGQAPKYVPNHLQEDEYAALQSVIVGEEKVDQSDVPSGKFRVKSIHPRKTVKPLLQHALK